MSSGRMGYEDPSVVNICWQVAILAVLNVKVLLLSGCILLSDCMYDNPQTLQQLRDSLL